MVISSHFETSVAECWRMREKTGVRRAGQMVRKASETDFFFLRDITRLSSCGDTPSCRTSGLTWKFESCRGQILILKRIAFICSRFRMIDLFALESAKAKQRLKKNLKKTLKKTRSTMRGTSKWASSDSLIKTKIQSDRARYDTKTIVCFPIHLF